MWSSWRRFSAWRACQSSASMLARLLLSEDMELRLRDERRAILACTNLVPECGLARQKNLVTDGLITRLYPLPRFRPSARSGHCALARANRVFCTNEKRIRNKTTVIDKSENGTLQQRSPPIS